MRNRRSNQPLAATPRAPRAMDYDISYAQRQRIKPNAEEAQGYAGLYSPDGRLPPGVDQPRNQPRAFWLKNEKVSTRLLIRSSALVKLVVDLLIEFCC